MTKLDVAIAFCGLFEAELLVDLMLRFWEHPNAGARDDVDYLVEAAAEVLNQSKAGTVFIEGVAPSDMNFVAAVWYAEYCNVADESEIANGQLEWLSRVRRSLPSCFCDPGDLIP